MKIQLYRRLAVVACAAFFIARSALAAPPVAIYTGQNPNAPNASDFRFNFNTKIYDSNNSVTTGTDWRYKAPMTAVYHLDAQFMVSFGNPVGDERFPYVACRVYLLPVNQTTPVLITQSNGFNTNCTIATDLVLKAGELLYVDVGQASGKTRAITGRFSLHWVRAYP